MIKVLFFHDGSIIKIPFSAYDKLHNSENSMLQYAGKRIRCVMIFMDLGEKAVARIKRLDYFLLHFNKKGALDPRQIHRSSQLAMRQLSFGVSSKPEYEKTRHLMEIDRLNSEVEYKSRFRWLPSSHEKQIIWHMMADEIKKKYKKILSGMQ